MKNKILTTAVCLMLILSSGALAQKKNTLIRGKVLDDANNQPLSVTFVFRSESGLIIPIKSNGNDGSYQGVLNNGHYYGIGLKGWLIVSPGDNIETVGDDAYHEITRDFRLRKIETGVKISAAKIFEPGSTELSGDYVRTFSKIFGFLEANANAAVILKLTTEDSYFSAKAEKKQVTDAKGKVKTQKVTISALEQADALMKGRAAAINRYLADFKKYNRRVLIEEDLKIGAKPAVPKTKPKSKKGQPEVPLTPVKNIDNITFFIGKILDL